MARPKRNSATLERAERRLESLQSIDHTLDLGGGLTVANFAAQINDLAAKLALYNTTLSTIDKLADDIKTSEKAVSAMAERMLLGVGSRYGKASQEYEMAGGARRKRRSSQTFPTTATVSPPAPMGDPAQNGAATHLAR